MAETTARELHAYTLRVDHLEFGWVGNLWWPVTEACAMSGLVNRDVRLLQDRRTVDVPPMTRSSDHTDSVHSLRRRPWRNWTH